MTSVIESDVSFVEKEVEAMGSLAKSCMEFHWPSLGKFSTYELWAHEYVKHASGLNPDEYFSLALTYFYKLTNNLKYKTNKEYTISEFYDILREHATNNMQCNHIPKLYCIESDMIKCMRKQKMDLTRLVFQGISTRFQRTNTGLETISSTKDNWVETRRMLIPYKDVQEG